MQEDKNKNEEDGDDGKERSTVKAFFPPPDLLSILPRLLT